MTIQELLKKKEDIKAQILALKSESVKIEQEYIDSLPVKKGDYVHIDYKPAINEDVWIAGIQLCSWDGSLNVYINRHRKDGTRSFRHEILYGVKISDIKVVKND